MSWNKMNQYKQGKIYIQIQQCPNCQTTMVKRIREDLMGKEWFCFACQIAKKID